MTIRTLAYIHKVLEANRDAWCQMYEIIRKESIDEEAKDECFNHKMEAINALDEFEEHEWS